MSISAIFKIFHKKENPTGSAFLSQATTSIRSLAEKSAALSDSFSEERDLILQIQNEVNDILPEDNPKAIKFEHAILEKLTRASALCDKAITGHDSGEFKDSVCVLKNLVNQRKNFVFEDEK